MSALTDIFSWIEQARDPTSEIGHSLRGAIVIDGGLTPAMSDWTLSRCLGRYTVAAMERLEVADLAGLRVGIVLARSVPIAPIRAIFLPLLRGAAAVDVRPSSTQVRVVEVIAKSFQNVMRVAWPERRCEYVIAYGGDDAITAIRDGLPPATEFEGHGHGFGVGLHGGELTPSVVRALAEDVAAFDQFGCLSPQCVLTSGDPAALARVLCEQLEEIDAKLPRAPLPTEQAAAIAQWRGRLAVRGARFLSGRNALVAHLTSSHLADSPGGRCIAVIGVPSPDEFSVMLQPVSRHLSCVGVSSERLMRCIPPDCRARLVPIGEMQDPPLDGPEDPRPPMSARPR